MGKHEIECPHCDDGDGVCRTALDGTTCDTCGEGRVCRVCGGLGVVHHDPRLRGRKSCAVCGMRRSWGCGHTPEDETAALDHCDTTEHLLGDCECYVSRSGYAALVSREERREQAAALVRALPILREAHEACEQSPVASFDLCKRLRDALPAGRGW